MNRSGDYRFIELIFQHAFAKIEEAEECLDTITYTLHTLRSVVLGGSRYRI